MLEDLRLGYCLTVHKNPFQVKRLVHAIYTPDDWFHITVYCREGEEEEWRRSLSLNQDNIAISFARIGAWATFAYVQETLRVMRWLSQFDYDYFLNLSGQCYPIKPLGQIKKTLRGGKSFLTARSIPDPQWNVLGRFHRWYYRIPTPDLMRKVLFRPESDRNMFIWVPRVSGKLPSNFQPYGGWSWMIIKRGHVDHVLDFLVKNPNYCRFFQHVLAADEHFFQTILMNSPLKDEVVPECQTYIDWRDKGLPTPNILTLDDYEELQHSPLLFARKFDEKVDQAILDKIDATLLRENK